MAMRPLYSFLRVGLTKLISSYARMHTPATCLSYSASYEYDRTILLYRSLSWSYHLASSIKVARTNVKFYSDNSPYLNITLSDLKTRLQSRDHAHLIDVREPSETANGHILGSIKIPLGDLQSSLNLNDKAFAEKYGITKPSPTDEVIFMCHSGVRSKVAIDISKKIGFENVKEYAGGWKEWSEQKTP